MRRFIILSIAILICFVSARAQVAEGMKYRELKNLYDAKTYVHQDDDAVNPAWAGVASFFIPGLGQCIAGEWGRGLGFIAADLGLAATAICSLTLFQVYDTPPGFPAISAGNAIAIGAGVCYALIDIWSIFDAVKVAKVRNMYEQDLRSQSASLTLQLEPFFAYSQPGYNSTNHPAAGVSLKLRF